MIHKYTFLFCFICFLSLYLFRYYKIVTSSENYSTVLSKLRDEGVNFEPDNGSELLPLATVEVVNLYSLCHTNLRVSSTDKLMDSILVFLLTR